MTYREAKWLVGFIADRSCKTDADKEAMKLVMEALEKQEPKKPKTSYDWYSLVRWECVECGGTIDSPMGYSVEKYLYCPYCGQAIDWSEEE